MAFVIALEFMCFRSCKSSVIDSGTPLASVRVMSFEANSLGISLLTDRQTDCSLLRSERVIWFGTPNCGVCHEAGLWQGEILLLQASPLLNGKKFVNASTALCGICSLLQLLR